MGRGWAEGRQGVGRGWAEGGQGQKKISDPLELELLAIGRCHEDAEKQT